MTQDLLKFNARSLIIVLISFIGNGQIMGVDVVLTLLPLAVILKLRDPWVIHRNALLPILLLVLILVLAAIRAPEIGITYFDAYYLWPIKALLLMLLVAFGGEQKWPTGNMVALAMICAALIAVGNFEHGRLSSIFGPNMLYRIFGLLLFFSIMLYFKKHDGNRLLLLAFSAFGLFASLLTGSAGALMVITAVFFIVSLRISKSFSLIVVIAGLYWILTSGILTGTLSVGDGAPTAIARLAYKSTTIMVSDRFLGWSEIITSPFSLVGHTHADFSNLWTYGFVYPHNLFVELYGFYGLIGLTLCLVIFLAITRSVSLMLDGDILAMTFLVLSVGSMLSGDLSDNYGVVGLACGLLVRSARFPLSRTFA